MKLCNFEQNPSKTKLFFYFFQFEIDQIFDVVHFGARTPLSYHCSMMTTQLVVLFWNSARVRPEKKHQAQHH